MLVVLAVEYGRAKRTTICENVWSIARSQLLRINFFTAPGVMIRERLISECGQPVLGIGWPVPPSPLRSQFFEQPPAQRILLVPLKLGCLGKCLLE